MSKVQGYFADKKLKDHSQSELDFLDGVTAGTRTASKAIVVDASGTIDALDIDAPAIGGVNITSTAAELNKLDGFTGTYTDLNYIDVATAGTAEASKAVVLDANSAIDAVNTAALSLGTSGSETLVTSTAAQLNTAGTKSTYGARFFYLGAPELDDADQIVTSTNMKVGTYTIAANPDVPRVLTVTHTQVGGVTDTLGTIDFVGTDAADAALTETITPSESGTATGLKAFKTVTSATGVGWVVDTTEDTITIGTGPALGLPETVVTSTTNALGYLAGTSEAISAVGTGADVPNSTVTLTSALDGSAVHVITNA